VSGPGSPYKPVGGIFSVGVEEPYRWKDSVQAGPEIRLWALDGIANGLRPWFTKFSGTLYDRRWLPVEGLGELAKEAAREPLRQALESWSALPRAARQGRLASVLERIDYAGQRKEASLRWRASL
jgi:hypothetical protein